MGDRADALREFHTAYGVPLRDVPTADVPETERLLRARLVLEEALEFVDAMGCLLFESVGQFAYPIEGATLEVRVDPDQHVDLVEAADALADTAYVVEGSAVQLGINLSEVFKEVHASNMSKLGADGKPIYRPDDGKVLKGPSFRPPDLLRVLIEQGWSSCERFHLGEDCRPGRNHPGVPEA